MATTMRQGAGSALTAILALTAIGCLLPVGQLPAAEANTWQRIGEGTPIWRNGGALVFAPDVGKMLFFGGVLDRFKVPKKDLPKRDVHYVQAFDPISLKWSTYSEARPERGCHPHYRAAYDARTGTVYCLTTVLSRLQMLPYPPPEGLLFSFDLTAQVWKAHDRDPALKDMNWHTMALDPEKRRLIVVGADKRPDNVGWSRTVIYDIDSGRWTRLPLPDAETVKEHRELVAATEALIDLVGRTRLAWYRDPKGIGTEAELEALHKRCADLGAMPGMANFKDDLKGYDELISARKTLDALKSARALQAKIEAHAEAQYPVPPSRRNSPLVYDARNRCMVLFGGDHEDYLTNDTWILDLEKDAWRRASPEQAPRPRAGHAMVYLPASGRIAMYGGYQENNSPSYGYGPRWARLLPIQVWTFDVGEERWDLVTSWTPTRDNASTPDYHGSFYGQYAGNFSPALLASDGGDRLYLASEEATWRLEVDSRHGDAPEAAKPATSPNQRVYRTGFFRAAYCEVPDPPPEIDLDGLPANRFIKLPAPPRNVCRACRARPYSTAIWDPDGDQIILWGGGHCIRSENPPIHYSPVSGRMVEGYDPQESYSVNGAIGSTVMNRPWVPGHSYGKYAYDPKSGRMVATCAEIYLYDPSRMDWLRGGPIKRPDVNMAVHSFESSRHGAVALASKRRGPVGLWLLDLDKGWIELVKPGHIPAGAGGAYDGTRDRLLLGYTGGWKKTGDGGLLAFHFRDRRIEKLTPANADLGGLIDAREMTYVEHADWMLFGDPYLVGKDQDARQYLRAYDCAGNRWVLLDVDGFPAGPTHSQGWMYDAKRQLVYVVNTNRWGVWALRLDPKTVRTLTDKP